MHREQIQPLHYTAAPCYQLSPCTASPCPAPKVAATPEQRREAAGTRWGCTEETLQVANLQEGTLWIKPISVMKMQSAPLRHTGPGRAAVVHSCCEVSPANAFVPGPVAPDILLAKLMDSCSRDMSSHCLLHG